MKPEPIGIFCLLPVPAGTGIPSELELGGTLDNANIDGFRWRTGWKVIQPDTTGNPAIDSVTYDWSTIDYAISKCLPKGKTLGINIAVGINTPNWVYAGTPIVYKLFCDNGGLDGDGFQPVPWDTNYLAKIAVMIAAFGARYDPDPTVSYIILSGFMQLAEDNFVFIADDDVFVNDLAVSPPGGIYTGLTTPWPDHRVDQGIGVVVTNGSPNITIVGNFTFEDAWDERGGGILINERTVTGYIPPGTTILSVNSPTTATMSANATGTGSIPATLKDRYGTAAVDAYVDAAEQIIAMFNAAFPNTSVLITQSRPFPTTPGVKAGIDIRQWGLASSPSFGSATSSLKASCPPHNGPPGALLAYPKGFQAIYASNHTPQGAFYVPGSPCLPTVAPQPLDDMLGNAYDSGAKYVEVYKPDCDNASPAAQQVLHDRRIDLQSNAGGGVIVPPPPVTETFATTPTGIPLQWTVYVPDTDPHPAVLVEHTGGFKTGVPGPLTVAADIAAAGFMGIAPEYRLAPPHSQMNSANGHPAPGQDDVADDGRYPKQTEDCRAAVRAARADPRCNGIVGIVGGSAGASHALFLAATGTPGDDRPDFVVLMSGVYDLANPAFLAVDCGIANDETCPHGASMNYIGRTDNWPVYSPADIAALSAASPNTYLTAAACPIFVLKSSFDSIGIAEQFDTLVNPVTGKFAAIGLTESTAAVPEEGKYKELVVTVPEHAHAFAYWNPVNFVTDPPNVGPNIIITWIIGAVTGGGGGGEPPPNNLLGYKARLKGGPGVIPSVISKYALSFGITGLAPATDYELSLLAFNQYGEGPPAIFDFVSDPDITVGGTPKTRQKGVYNLLSAPDGDSGDVTDLVRHPFWDFPYIDGSRYRTSWSTIQPVDEEDYVWDNIDSYLDLCITKNKFAGLSISAGIACPFWLGARTFVEHGPFAGTMVIPWDTIFLGKWATLIGAYGAKYDAHPQLAYVVMGGMGQVIDTYVVASPSDQAALDAIAVADGYLSTVDAWTVAAKQMIAVFLSAFPTTLLLLSAIKPVNSSAGNTAITSLMTWMIDTFGPTRVGFMNSTLNGITYSGTSVVTQAIFDNRLTYFTGYEFGFPTSNSKCDPSQPQPPIAGYDPLLGLQNTLSAGVAQGSEFLELWESDVNNLDSDYVDEMTTTQAALKAQ